MNKLVKCLWQDEYGVILSAELVIIGSVLVVGLITGMTCLQQAVNGEMVDLADAFGSLDQSYSFAGRTGCSGCGPVCTAGSSYRDCKDPCDEKCGDMVAAHCVNPCLAVGCGAGCASGGCVGGAGCLGGAHCISTGVPHMKVTEWHAAAGTDPCCETPVAPKESFLNIPENVW